MISKWKALTNIQKTASALVVVPVMMLGLAYASVPFYDWFCRVTGFGGATGVAEVGSDVILDQISTFDAQNDAH